MSLFKEEIKSYTQSEIIVTSFIIFFIIINGFYIKDNIISILSALFGILYTINAGKGKIICYIYGLIGSCCYSYLALKNAIWGNLALWILYYIPSEILGIILWKRHLKKNSKTIIKQKMNTKNRTYLTLFCIFGSYATILILNYFQDSNPVFDGITTFLSIVGMYLTLKRYIEQWYIWIIVNFLSIILWINVMSSGEKTFSTIIMWIFYLFLAFYFLKQWQKEV